MEFLDAINPEWSAIWEELSNHEINNGDPICLNLGQCWEYMGSTADHHHLRHLKHPKTKKPEFVYIERRRAVLNWAS